MRGMAKNADPKARDTHLMQVKLTADQLEKLDDLRRGSLTFPTRSDIIRDLIEKAHATKRK